MPFVRRIFLYSPLITNITVLQKKFVTKGKKRVKRARKLYYLMDRRPDVYTVNKEKITAWYHIMLLLYCHCTSSSLNYKVDLYNALHDFPAHVFIPSAKAA